MSDTKMIIIALFMILGFFGVGYRAIIPTNNEKSLIADKKITSWQPGKDTFLGQMMRIKTEYSLGFDVPFKDIAYGKSIKAPYSFFPLSTSGYFGFDLEGSQLTQFIIKAKSFCEVQMSVDNLDVYLNNQRPNTKLTDWTFRYGDTLGLRSSYNPVKGTLIITRGSYDYIGQHTEVVRTLSLQPWSFKNTGYKGVKGEVVLIESLNPEIDLNFLVYNWDTENGVLEDTEVNGKWYTFWQFKKPGLMVIQSLENALNINIVTQGIW